MQINYIRRVSSSPPTLSNIYLHLELGCVVELAALEHTASTDSCFSTLGHGSVPKFVFDMLTKQLSRPKHFCEKTSNRVEF